MNHTSALDADPVDGSPMRYNSMVATSGQTAAHITSPDELKQMVENFNISEMDLSTKVIKEEPLDIDSGMSEIAVQFRKKRGLSNGGKEEELCLICGDRASGYHYNALSCEGCKGFFRRSITRGAVYRCKEGGNCEMDMWMRRRCQACRLRRCREVGMKEECLLSDEQCKARDVRRKSRVKPSKTPNDSPKGSPQSITSTEEPDPHTVLPITKPPPELKVDPGMVLGKLEDTEKQLIEKLVMYQDKFELPSEDDIKLLTSVKVESLGKMSMSDSVFQQMAGMTILVTHLVVEFSKHLPGFSQLERDDQIALLKGSACEVMMIRTSRRYDLQTDTIIFADGSPYTRQNLYFGGLYDYVDCMFMFCKGMGVMNVDNAEYALLTAICIFSDRPCLTERSKVEYIQEMYVNALRNYVNLRRPTYKTYFANMLMKLTELRTLSVHYEKVLENMRVERGPLPPLLAEYFTS